MNTTFQISKPCASPQKSRPHFFNNAVMYTTLVYMPMTALEADDSNETIFEACGYENEASAIVSDIFNMRRAGLKHKLDLMSKLSPNRDGYGAPAIGKASITKCKSVISSLSDNVIIDVRVNPTEFGRAQLLYVNPIKNTKISVDFGDNAMSFYVLNGEAAPRFYSFLPYTDKNITLLTSLLESRIA